MTPYFKRIQFHQKKVMIKEFDFSAILNLFIYLSFCYINISNILSTHIQSVQIYFPVIGISILGRLRRVEIFSSGAESRPEVKNGKNR